MDTTLSLSPLGSTNKKSKGKCSNDDDQNQEMDTSAASTISNDEIYNPMPLRWLRPDGVSSWNDQNQVGCSEKKRKRGDNVDQRPKQRKINGGDDENNEGPLVPIEEIPGLYGTLELHDENGVVFLYRKKLEESDVQKGRTGCS